MLRSKYVPVSAVWEITLACNMKCMHCGSSAGKKRSNELTTEEALNLCEELKELGTSIITLIGGEPFLREDWYIIAKKIRELGMDLTFISNGLLINRKTISQLKKLNPYAVAISLDGALSDTHDSIRGVKGSFNKCMSSLRLLKEVDLPTSVITTLHEGNVKELPKIRKFLLNKGIAWQIQMAGPTGRFPKDLVLSKGEFYSAAMFISSSRNRYSIKELPVMGAHNFGYHSQILGNLMISPIWKGCQAGITTIGIQSNGSIKGCLSLPDDYIEGNIRNQNLTEMWNSPSFALYNRKFKKEDLKGGCKTCKYGKSCKGGCETVSTAITGEMHGDPYCLYLIEKESFK
ncbi:MAG: radical SAM protein [Thermoplasmatales archaeon]|nr:radical SAM protein [Thermoplasmatales archaeon]